ncbi:MAG: rhodanese-like domain-containing protein [Anaerolineales bacterium]|jgi:3-mercaptopyruvate sulfurtransferase SseA
MTKTNVRKALFALVTGIAFIAAILTACAPTSEPVSPAAEAPGEIQRITLEESKVAFDNGEAIFVDVRSAGSFTAGHIPGALSIPLAELPTRIEELDPNQWIITYCT